MKLARIELAPLCLRLRRPLVTSHGVLRERTGLRVRLRDPDGVCGVGESFPLTPAGTETLARSAAALEAGARALDGASGELDELLDAVEQLAPDAPAARFALDAALHDLEARRTGLPVARLLSPAPRTAIPVNALLDDLAPAGVESARRRGFSTVKLKLARDDLGRQIEQLARLRAGPARELRLRLDPNGSWSRTQAHEAIARLAALAPELIEQPVEPGDLEGLRALSRGPVPIAADEALAHRAARAALIDGELTPLAVLKPMVLGGLRAALRLARAAAGAGVRCFVTTTLDGPCAAAAAAQLAFALCDGSLAHGLAAAESVEAAFPDWLEPRTGRLRLPALPGLGVTQA